MSLNPYFNGIYFLTTINVFADNKGNVVLILILMEYTFWRQLYPHTNDATAPVLILILMEYTFWRIQLWQHVSILMS